METSFGLSGKGPEGAWVILAADMNAARSIVKMKGDEDKGRVVGKTMAFTINGEAGDTTNFADYVQANLKLSVYRNNVETSPPAAANWIRNQLAASIRSRSPKSVNLLLGGYDAATDTPHLYWLDYLGTLGEVPFAAHGYGSYFCLSTMDRYHNPKGTWEDGLETLKRCINELQTRFIVDLGRWKVRVITKDGIKEMILGEIPPPKGAKPANEVAAMETISVQPVLVA